MILIALISLNGDVLSAKPTYLNASYVFSNIETIKEIVIHAHIIKQINLWFRKK